MRMKEECEKKDEKCFHFWMKSDEEKVSRAAEYERCLLYSE